MSGIIEIITADTWWKAVLVLIGVALPIVWGILQRRQLEQNAFFHREGHNLNLFKYLADPNPATQMAVAGILIERLMQTPKKEIERSDRRTMIRTMISLTKHESSCPELCKAIGDSVPKVLGVLDLEKKRKRLGERSPMLDFDWQGVRFYRTYWRGMDARKVDFFGAQLVDIGMREAQLSGAIFRSAVLQRCGFEDADLSEADLRGADLREARLRSASLRGAQLAGAVYDERTTFPEGFDPEKAQMIWAASDKELAA